MHNVFCKLKYASFPDVSLSTYLCDNMTQMIILLLIDTPGMWALIVGIITMLDTYQLFPTLFILNITALCKLLNELSCCIEHRIANFWR